MIIGRSRYRSSFRKILNIGKAQAFSSKMAISNPPGFSRFSDVIDSYDNFVFDCDGVIWESYNPIGDSFRVLENLMNRGKKVRVIFF